MSDERKATPDQAIREICAALRATIEYRHAQEHPAAYGNVRVRFRLIYPAATRKLTMSLDGRFLGSSGVILFDTWFDAETAAILDRNGYVLVETLPDEWTLAEGLIFTPGDDTMVPEWP